MSELYVTSRDKNEYPVYLTKEELEAIPIILNMAMVYSWDLYDKKEDDKYYKIHKENIDLIKAYHDKGYQGVIAVGNYIEGKAKNVLNGMELDKVLEPYINSNQKQEEITAYYLKEIKIENHVGIFNDEYTDHITAIYDENKPYDAIPIDGKFTIPYIKDGTAIVAYKIKKMIDCNVLYKIGKGIY